MRLRDIHPEDFLRAGALFGMVSEHVGDTVSQSRSCAEVRWVGRPNQLYQERLRDLSKDLSRVRSSFDDASGALIAYAHSLGIVRDLALQADLLEAQAQDLIQYRQRQDWHDHQDGTVVTSLALTPQEEALRERARLLHAEAEEISLAASRRVTSHLRDLADHAVKVEGWQSLNRGMARAAQGFSGVVSTDVTLAADAFQAIPGVGDDKSRSEARTELWAAGASMLQPWLAVEQFVSQLEEGDYARTGGEVAGVLVLKGHGGKKEALFGAHNAMPLEVLGAMKGFQGIEQSVLGHAQQTFWKQLQHFAKLPAPTVEELLRDGVDLVQQEALGGHTVLKHVGRDLDFLGRRQRVETKPGRRVVPASSFTSQEEAEFLINRVLAVEHNMVDLRTWAKDRRGTDVLRLTASSDGVGALRAGSGAVLRSRYVIVDFAKHAGGGIFVYRSYVDVS